MIAKSTRTRTRTNRLFAWLVLASCAWLGRPTARACEPAASLQPVGMVQGPNGGGSVAAGSDLLLEERCEELRCPLELSAIDITLITANGATLPWSLEAIEPSPEHQRLIRLHPSEPLLPGPHSLRIRVARDAGRIDAQDYHFSVEGAASVAPSAAMTIELAGPVEIDHVPAGTRFRCSEASSCGASAVVHTQRQRVLRLTAAVSEPPPAIELGQYVYRLAPFAAEPGSIVSAPWVAFGAGAPSAGWLSLSSREPGPAHCVVLQALRIRDMQVQALSTRCMRRDLAPGLPEPEPFARCAIREGQGTYARAWCSENRRACSAENPDAASERLRSACSAYPQICAPFLASQGPARECAP